MTKGPTLKATSSVNFVSLWVYGRLGLCLTMPEPMVIEMSSPSADMHDREIEYGLEGRLTGSIFPSWYMLTTLQDWPSLDTAHII